MRGALYECEGAYMNVRDASLVVGMQVLQEELSMSPSPPHNRQLPNNASFAPQTEIAEIKKNKMCAMCLYPY